MSSELHLMGNAQGLPSYKGYWSSGTWSRELGTELPETTQQPKHEFGEV